MDKALSQETFNQIHDLSVALASRRIVNKNKEYETAINILKSKGIAHRSLKSLKIFMMNELRKHVLHIKNENNIHPKCKLKEHSDFMDSIKTIPEKRFDEMALGLTGKPECFVVFQSKDSEYYEPCPNLTTIQDLKKLMILDNHAGHVFALKFLGPEYQMLNDRMSLRPVEDLCLNQNLNIYFKEWKTSEMVLNQMNKDCLLEEPDNLDETQMSVWSYISWACDAINIDATIIPLINMTFETKSQSIAKLVFESLCNNFKESPCFALESVDLLITHLQNDCFMNAPWFYKIDEFVEFKLMLNFAEYFQALCARLQHCLLSGQKEPSRCESFFEDLKNHNFACINHYVMLMFCQLSGDLQVVSKKYDTSEYLKFVDKCVIRYVTMDQRVIYFPVANEPHERHYETFSVILPKIKNDYDDPFKKQTHNILLGCKRLMSFFDFNKINKN